MNRIDRRDARPTADRAVHGATTDEPTADRRPRPPPDDDSDTRTT